MLPDDSSVECEVALATAVAYKAIRHGYNALFATAVAIIDDLALATRQGRFRECLKAYVQP